jgi:hypothetical protein
VIGGGVSCFLHCHRQSGVNCFSNWQEAALALAEGEAAPAEAEERQTIYNTDALHDKLEDISWTVEQPWVETQVITHAEATQVDSVDDDLARELAFYNQVHFKAIVAVLHQATVKGQ